jgi:hypothetical protein
VRKIYPEHRKLKAVVDRSQTIGEFLDWLEEKGLWLANMDVEGPRMSPYYYKKENILAEFFGIDLKKIEKEKLAMLEELRALPGK